MSRWRRLAPAHSPLSLGAIVAPMGWEDPRPELRQVLTSTYDASRVLLTDSGTSALLLALRAAAAARPGRPCVLPAYGCYDLATAAIGADVEVVLYDVDPSTLQPVHDRVTGSPNASVCREAAQLPVDGLSGAVRTVSVAVPTDCCGAEARYASAVIV